MSETPAVHRPTLNDRLFEAIGLSPIAFTALTSLALFAVFIATVHATGQLAEFLADQERWWQVRDGRVAVIVAILAGYIPAARRLEEIGAQRHLEQIRRAFPWTPAHFEALVGRLTPSPRWMLAAGAFGLSMLPVILVSVDRDPWLYLRSEYWNAVHLWTIPLTAFVCWNTGALVGAVTAHNRIFSRIAREAPRPDLLDLDAFEPFARQALRSLLPGVVTLALLAFNLVDRAFLWAVALIGSAGLAWTAGSLYWMLHGARERIATIKRDECDRIDAAIRGEPGALADSPLARRQPPPGLGDLLAWRRFVESRPEWPIDTPMRARLLLYLAIPLGSWLGGAVVDHLLDLLLG